MRATWKTASTTTRGNPGRYRRYPRNAEHLQLLPRWQPRWRHGAAGQGITGRGINVAVLDTGHDARIDDFEFSDDGRARQVAMYDLDRGLLGQRKFEDESGHGSHITSLIAGSELYEGRHNGVAPGAVSSRSRYSIRTARRATRGSSKPWNGSLRTVKRMTFEYSTCP